MEMDNLKNKIRGIVEPTELESAELNRLKEKIYLKHKKQDKAREEFLLKSQYFLAGIPEEYWDIEWENCYVESKYKEIVKKYCDNIERAFEAGQGLILTGKHGVGKTTLSCIIGKTAILKGYTVKYISIAKIIDMIAGTFNDREAKERLDTLVERIEFLILDDLGKEYEGVKKQLNPMVSLKLDCLLRERLNHGLVTVGTTNITPKELKMKYGESVYSVIGGACKVIEVQGKDIRLMKGVKFWKELGI